jgi:hypothetical protein
MTGCVRVWYRVDLLQQGAVDVYRCLFSLCGRLVVIPWYDSEFDIREGCDACDFDTELALHPRSLLIFFGRVQSCLAP